jgi:cysteine desulfurase/selenocysteine lyase
MLKSDVMPSFEIEKIRKDFPILARQVHGKNLVYFDNAASAQKPKIVLDTLQNFYSQDYANVHRGVHYLSQISTDAFEKTRDAMQVFIGAKHREEIIFTAGTTASINLVAQCFGEAFIGEGDEILVSALEHHANLVPWQICAQKRKAVLRIMPMLATGELDMEKLPLLLTEKTKILAITATSNALGTITDLANIIPLAHRVGAKVLVDGAQSIAHHKTDVQTLDADFWVCSSHKLFGPTGVGVLYGKKDLLEAMPVYQSGGDMIKTVRYESSTYNELPHKFEAGTPNIADVIAFGSALDYINNLDWHGAMAHKKTLHESLEKGLLGIEGLRIIGTAKHKAPLSSFVVEGVHNYDLGVLIDKMGIAIRTGHHCAEPIMDFFGVAGTARASLSFYNTQAEVDYFLESLKKAINMLR